MNDANPKVKSILSNAIKEIKSVPVEYDRCLRCGKRLKTTESRRRGYGDECYFKLLESRIHKNKLIKGSENADR